MDENHKMQNLGDILRGMKADLASGTSKPSEWRSPETPSCALCNDTGLLYWMPDPAIIESWSTRLRLAIRERQHTLIKLRPLRPRPGFTIGKHLEELLRLRWVLRRGFEHSAHNQGRIATRCRCILDAWERNRIERIRNFAGLSPSMEHMTFGNWHSRPELTNAQNEGLHQALGEAQKFARGEAEYKVLVLSSPRGSGKTHLMVSIVQAMVARMELARYRYVPAMLQELLTAVRDQREDGPTVNELIQSYREVGMLALDDLGAGRETPTPWCLEQLEAIIKERYEMGRFLVVTTNLTMRELGDRWGPRIADCLWDKHTGRAKQLMLNVPSFRTGVTW